MTMSADEIIDRRRLRRKLTFWRVAAFLILAGLVVAIAGASGTFERLSRIGSDHIARVEISGMIIDEEDTLKLLKKLRDRDQVKAVILDISSPGGSTVSGETLYNAVLDLAKEKPVVTSVGTLAASAGYMIACASDHIVAHRSSILGSIGVLIQYGNAVELLDKLGVEVDAVKSSPLKAQPNPFSQTSEEAKQMLARVVDDSYEWFIGLVAERRDMSMARARMLADGSIFTGAQSLENGLIDQIGDEETARKWLVSDRGIDDDLKIIDWDAEREDSGSGFPNPAAFAAVAWLFGVEIDKNAAAQLQEYLSRRLFLDGLVSLMHTS